MNEKNPTLTVQYIWKDNFNRYQNCIYTGSKSNLYVKPGKWKVKNCTCLACCFGVGQKFNIDLLDDYQNRPSINYFTGELTGEYCENTLAAEDFCSASSAIII